MTTIGFCPPSVPDPITDVALRLAACPLCHTTDAITTMSALEAGGSWRCRVCHQSWNARRLATVTAYEAWALDHGTRREIGESSA
jgi:transcription elongation factor Elf1